MEFHFSKLKHRSFRMDFLLAAIALIFWFLLDAWQADINLLAPSLSLAIEQPQWQPHFSPGPWVLVILGLGLAYWRRRSPGPDAAVDPAPHDRLCQLALLIFALTALRLLSLWNPVAYLFPYLALLWAPHATWALGLLVPLFLHASLATAAKNGGSERRIAALIFLFCLLSYAAYTLYFCQLTMLHGDEGQYLRVTQSLIHDRDMDLANNLDTDYTKEFHVSRFDVHKAPSSPPDKVYSGHPIGLSVLLLPAYLSGLELWQNPRLGAALFMALLAAACAALFFVWLVRLGVERFAALLGVGIVATTAPFFLYTNQLYPEVPALLIALLVLVGLAHWQRPGGGYRSLGSSEPVLLAGLVFLLGALLFLHPRFIALAAFLGGLVGLQAWHSTQRRAALLALGLSATACLAALLAYHAVLTGDWLGHFRPGAAWDQKALQIGIWQHSLSGHWLDRKVGLLNSSPIFLLVPVGWLLLGLQRDRRFFLALALYAATAAVHGLHTEWEFGFGFPARFLITALPALLCGLVFALRALSGSATAFFLLSMALTISLETTVQTLALPESGYRGENLMSRTVNDHYPFAVHFTPSDHDTLPFQDLVFWALLLSPLLLKSSPPFSSRRLLQGVLILIAAFLPALWGHTQTISARLKKATSPYLNTSRASAILDNTYPAYPLDLSKRISFLNRIDLAAPRYVGTPQTAGRHFALEQKDPAGILTSVRLPILKPGFYGLAMPDLRALPAPDQNRAPGQLIVSLRHTLPAISRWEERLSRPIAEQRRTNPQPLMELYIDRRRIGYVDLEYSGSGTLSVDKGFLLPLINTSMARSTLVDRLSADEVEGPAAADSSSHGAPMAMGAFYPGLDKGHYSVRFAVEGTVLKTWFKRFPESVYMAVFSAPTGAAPGEFSVPLTHWFLTDMKYGGEVARPLVESLQAPWWSSVPSGDKAFKLFFSLPESQDVFFLIKYAGPESLRLDGLALYAETVETGNEKKAVEQRKAGALTPLSPRDMLVDLTNHYMRVLASCIKENDFLSLYQMFARSRQSQTTPENLAANFRGFVEAGADLTGATALAPVFSKEPYIGEDGILVLNGHYPTRR